MKLRTGAGARPPPVAVDHPCARESGNTHPAGGRCPTVPESLHAEVVHVIPPEDLDDVDLQPAFRTLADDRYVLVCRRGGAPSWFDRVKSFLLRRPIEAVTVVADAPLEEGEELTATVEPADIPGVYEVVDGE